MASRVWFGLALLHARRGRQDKAQFALERMTPWRESDDFAQRTIYAAVALVVALAAGRPEPAVPRAVAAQSEAITKHGASVEAARIGWADTLRGAIDLGRLDDARALIALPADLPPGRVPPYIRAHLALGRARLAVAEGAGGDIEANLRTAIDDFSELCNPYDLALAIEVARLQV